MESTLSGSFVFIHGENMLNENFKSPLVSCICCREVKSAKGIFSHFIMAHTDEGQERALRSGIAGGEVTKEIVKNTAIKQNIEKTKKYNEAPNMCQCGAPKPYPIRNNKFCSASCGAQHSNSIRSKESRKKQGKTLSANKKPTVKIKKVCHISWCKICNKCFEGRRITCSSECYRKNLSNVATANPKMGGNKNTRAYGWYESPSAGKVWLESSYEYQVAKSLDENKIDWQRPSYFSYGIGKKYFPDFYIPSINVFLDPKNDYLIEQDREKIEEVRISHQVKILVLTKDELSWEKILHKMKD
jgi:hypothetical protein